MLYLPKGICLIAFVWLRSTIREVVLIPNRHWGGEGLLGCVFGYAYVLVVFLRDPNVHLSTVSASCIGYLRYLPIASQVLCRRSSHRTTVPKSSKTSSCLSLLIFPVLRKLVLEDGIARREAVVAFMERQQKLTGGAELQVVCDYYKGE